MNYSQITQSAPVVLVEFYATWCPHCRKMMPVVEEVKELLSNRAEVVQLDIDKNDAAANAAGLESVPTFIVYAGDEERWRHSGEIEGEVLLSKVEGYV